MIEHQAVVSRGRRRVGFADGAAGAEAVDLASVGFLRHNLIFDEGRTLSLDYTELPCPRLVRHLTGALSSLAGVGGGHVGVESGRAYGIAIRIVVTFISQAHLATSATFDARQLTAADIDAFEETLRESVGSDSTLPYRRVSELVRLLRVLDRDAFLDHMLAARTRTQAEEWHAIYGEAHRRIVDDVLPRFPEAVVAAARAAGVSDPGAVYLPPELTAHG